MKKMRKNFTLIELLVVVGLASLLMGIMLPAFNRLISGNAVDRAASELKLALEHTQSIAASNHCNAALLLPSGPTSTYPWPDKYLFSSWRIALVSINDSGATVLYPYKSWASDSEWRFIDPRTKIVRVGVTSNKSDINETTGLNNCCTSKISSLYNNSTNNLKCITDIPKPEDAATKFSADCGIIFSQYGSLLNTTSDLYISVAEVAGLNGDNFVWGGGTGTKPLNFKTLKINRITGMVTYYPESN